MKPVCNVPLHTGLLYTGNKQRKGASDFIDKRKEGAYSELSRR